VATAPKIVASAQITKDSRVCGGEACIDNTRIRVVDIVPELLGEHGADYAGAVPMVGFGAGAYVLAAHAVGATAATQAP
jgi:hypothetical protein